MSWVLLGCLVLEASAVTVDEYIYEASEHTGIKISLEQLCVLPAWHRLCLPPVLPHVPRGGTQAVPGRAHPPAVAPIARVCVAECLGSVLHPQKAEQTVTGGSGRGLVSQGLC